MMTVQERLAADLAAIYIGNLNTVDADLTLPAQGDHGSVFTWESSEERFITPGGKVHRPLAGTGDRTVTLTVTASLGGETRQREFRANVLQDKRGGVIAEAEPVSVVTRRGVEAELPSVVIVRFEDGRLSTAPASWEEHPASTKNGISHIHGTIEGTEVPALAVIRVAGDEVFSEAEAAAKESGDAPSEKVQYYPIQDVRLTEGSIYREYQQKMNHFLSQVDDDQMLYNFRRAAGLDTKGAPPMTGWDEESCRLRGHTTGHYLSGLALAYAATGDPLFKQKVDYMVGALAECQAAFARKAESQEKLKDAPGTDPAFAEEGHPYHRGFLSAYSEAQFDMLEEYVVYPDIWAPWYTLDKIMTGLIDCCMLAGSSQAKEILDGMAGWVCDRMSRVPRAQREKMWSMYIAGEFGGMMSSMVGAWKLTGREEYRKAAEYFSNDKLFYPMEQNVDTLEDMHANQHIPQAIGAADLYEATGKAKWYRIARNFREIVTGAHIYANGGTGETEMFHAPHSTSRYLTDRAEESCASYNMLKLTGRLFRYEPEGRLMDYYENTLLNHILATASHEEDGGTIYFMPLGPGGRKTFDNEENSCCHGTGMESRYRYMGDLFARSQDAIWVNLPVPAHLAAEDAELTTALGEDGSLTVKVEKATDLGLRIHVPAWAQSSLQVFVNGDKTRVVKGRKTAQTSPEDEEFFRAAFPGESKAHRGAESGRTAAGITVELTDGYAVVDGPFAAGDTIRLQAEMKIRRVAVDSDETLVNITYGPYLLAGISDSRTIRQAPSPEAVRRTASGNSSPAFEAGGMKMIPLARLDREAYHVYFKK